MIPTKHTSLEEDESEQEHNRFHPSQCRCVYITEKPSQAHLRVCPFQLILCSSCNQSIPRHSVHIHNTESCIHRTVECHICGINIHASSIYTHLEQHTSCTQCNHPILLESSLSTSGHELTTCPLCKERRPMLACGLIDHIHNHHKDYISLIPSSILTSRSTLRQALSHTSEHSSNTDAIQHYMSTHLAYYTEDGKMPEGSEWDSEIPGLEPPTSYVCNYPMGEDSAVLIHPGFTAADGVLEWDLVSTLGAVVGVSPPGLQGYKEGTGKGCIVMTGQRVRVYNGEVYEGTTVPRFREERVQLCLPQEAMFLVRLDMTRRTVTWRDSGDPDFSNAVTRPLPGPGPYVLGLTAIECGSVSIHSFRRISNGSPLAEWAQCPSCEWEGMRLDLEGHMATCSGVLVACPNAPFGCTRMMVRDEWPEHLKTCEHHGCSGCGISLKGMAKDRQLQHFNTCDQFRDSMTTFGTDTSSEALTIQGPHTIYGYSSYIPCWLPCAVYCGRVRWELKLTNPGVVIGVGSVPKHITSSVLEAVPGTTPTSVVMGSQGGYNLPMIMTNDVIERAGFQFSFDSTALLSMTLDVDERWIEWTMRTDGRGHTAGTSVRRALPAVSSVPFTLMAAVGWDSTLEVLAVSKEV